MHLLKKVLRKRTPSQSLNILEWHGDGWDGGILGDIYWSNKKKMLNQISSSSKSEWEWVGSYPAGAVWHLWSSSLCPPSGSCLSFYSSPLQPCPRHCWCSPCLLFRGSFLSVLGLSVSQQIMSLNGTRPGLEPTWRFPAKKQRPADRQRGVGSEWESEVQLSSC